MPVNLELFNDIYAAAKLKDHQKLDELLKTNSADANIEIDFEDDEIIPTKAILPETPASVLATEGNQEAAELLIEKGANKNRVAYAAAKNGFTDFAELLRDKDNLVYLAQAAAEGEHKEYVEKLRQQLSDQRSEESEGSQELVVSEEAFMLRVFFGAAVAGRAEYVKQLYDGYEGDAEWVHNAIVKAMFLGDKDYSVFRFISDHYARAVKEARNPEGDWEDGKIFKTGVLRAFRHAFKRSEFFNRLGYFLEMPESQLKRDLIKMDKGINFPIQLSRLNGQISKYMALYQVPINLAIVLLKAPELSVLLFANVDSLRPGLSQEVLEYIISFVIGRSCLIVRQLFTARDNQVNALVKKFLQQAKEAVHRGFVLGNPAVDEGKIRTTAKVSVYLQHSAIFQENEDEHSRRRKQKEAGENEDSLESAGKRSKLV